MNFLLRITLILIILQISHLSSLQVSKFVKEPCYIASDPPLKGVKYVHNHI